MHRSPNWIRRLPIAWAWRASRKGRSPREGEPANGNAAEAADLAPEAAENAAPPAARQESTNRLTSAQVLRILDEVTGINQRRETAGCGRRSSRRRTEQCAAKEPSWEPITNG